MTPSFLMPSRYFQFRHKKLTTIHPSLVDYLIKYTRVEMVHFTSFKSSAIIIICIHLSIICLMFSIICDLIIVVFIDMWLFYLYLKNITNNIL